MKKIISTLSLVVGVTGPCYANIEGQLHWNGDVVIAIVEEAFSPALWAFGTERSMEYYNSGTDTEEYKNADYMYRLLREESANLLKTLLSKETFSFKDALDACYDLPRVGIEYKYICENIAKRLLNVATASFDANQSLNSVGDSVVAQKQRCVQHKIDYRGTQRTHDDEFLYSSYQNAKDGLGYECDPEGKGDTCNAGDIVFMPYAYLDGLRTNGEKSRFRCVDGAMNDYWEPIE